MSGLTRPHTKITPRPGLACVRARKGGPGALQEDLSSVQLHESFKTCIVCVWHHLPCFKCRDSSAPLQPYVRPMRSHWLVSSENIHIQQRSGVPLEARATLSHSTYFVHPCRKPDRNPPAVCIQIGEPFVPRIAPSPIWPSRRGG